MQCWRLLFSLIMCLNPVISCGTSRLEIIIEVLYQNTFYIGQLPIYLLVLLLYEEWILLYVFSPNACLLQLLTLWAVLPNTRKNKQP